MSLFRLGKRNFSLRESPGKLSSLSSVSSVVRAQISSPAKRVKTSESTLLLPSTVIQENRWDASKDQVLSETVASREVVDQQNSKSVDTYDCVQERPSAYTTNQTNASANITLPVQTPPPTPDIDLLTRIDLLKIRKENLLLEYKKLKSQLDQIIDKIVEKKQLSTDFERDRLTYQDLTIILNTGHNQMRDQLNEIYNPGQALAQQAEALMKEVHTKQDRRFEKMSLELNSRMDQAINVIRQKKESLIHEIELHQRTLMHLSEANKNFEVEKPNSLEKVSIDSDHEDLEKTIEENEDCIILDVQEGTPIKSDADVLSAELSKSNDNIQVVCEVDNDDEQTDVDEQSTEESRSFTPCQAQRPEI